MQVIHENQCLKVQIAGMLTLPKGHFTVSQS